VPRGTVADVVAIQGFFSPLGRVFFFLHALSVHSRIAVGCHLASPPSAAGAPTTSRSPRACRRSTATGPKGTDRSTGTAWWAVTRPALARRRRLGYTPRRRPRTRRRDTSPKSIGARARRRARPHPRPRSGVVASVTAAVPRRRPQSPTCRRRARRAVGARPQARCAHRERVGSRRPRRRRGGGGRVGTGRRRARGRRVVAARGGDARDGAAAASAGVGGEDAGPHLRRPGSTVRDSAG